MQVLVPLSESVSIGCLVFVVVFLLTLPTSPNPKKDPQQYGNMDFRFANTRRGGCRMIDVEKAFQRT